MVPSAAWPVTFPVLAHSPFFSLPLFSLIFQTSIQTSIIVKTFSPPPERDSALTTIAPHHCGHLFDLFICVYSQQQMTTMWQGLEKGLRTQRRFRHYPVLVEAPLYGTLNYLLFHYLSHLCVINSLDTVSCNNSKTVPFLKKFMVSIGESTGIKVMTAPKALVSVIKWSRVWIWQFITDFFFSYFRYLVSGWSICWQHSGVSMEMGFL